MRRWASHHWLACRLRYRDWWHEQWLPGRLTWLYFHDEAVAFAAGHRPCALCRRADYDAYRDALRGAGVGAAARDGADVIDRRLHAERLFGTAVGRRRPRRVHPTPWSELVDGAFVIEDERPALVLGDGLVAWSPTGYGEPRRRPRTGTAPLLTPPTTLAVLQAGYPVQIDATVR